LGSKRRISETYAADSPAQSHDDQLAGCRSIVDYRRDRRNSGLTEFPQKQVRLEMCNGSYEKTTHSLSFQIGSDFDAAEGIEPRSTAVTLGTVAAAGILKRRLHHATTDDLVFREHRIQLECVGHSRRSIYLAELRLRQRAEALQPLLILHSFRFIGLAFLIPGVVSPDLPAAFAHAAAYGDIIAATLALLSLLLLPSAAGVVATWIFSLWGSADLLNAFYQANHAGLLAGSWAPRSSFRLW